MRRHYKINISNDKADIF